MKYILLLVCFFYSHSLFAQKYQIYLDDYGYKILNTVKLKVDTLAIINPYKWNIKLEEPPFYIESFSIDNEQNLYVLFRGIILKYNTKNDDLIWYNKIGNKKYIFCYYYSNRIYLCGQEGLLIISKSGKLIEKKEIGNLQFEVDIVYPFFDKYLLFPSVDFFLPGKVRWRSFYDLNEGKIYNKMMDDSFFIWNCQDCSKEFLKDLFSGHKPIYYIGQSTKYLVFQQYRMSNYNSQPTSKDSNEKYFIFNKKAKNIKLINNIYNKLFFDSDRGYLQFINDTTFVYPYHIPSNIYDETSAEIIFQKIKFNNW